MLVRQHSPKTSSIWRTWVPQCGNPSCSTKTLLQAFTHRQHGLKVEDDWYCGADCFAQVFKGKIMELMTSQGKTAKARSSRVPLGLLLLSRGILTPERLKVALDHQRLTKLDFGNVVQELGFATQEQVTAAVAAQWACPVFPLGDQPLELQIRIPRQFLDLYEMLPVHYSENEHRLMIGFVRSVQHQALYTIGHVTSCTVVPCFITAREYELHLNAQSTPSLRDSELVFDQIVDTAEMARLTTNYVVQLAAERVRMGKCRDYVWVRIWGHKQEMDLLFRVQND
jgi:Type II secretion system (T2SS), protein E, N-terminal domain